MSDKEAEEKVRIVYQALQRQALEQLSEAVGGGVIRREVKERLLPEYEREKFSKKLSKIKLKDIAGYDEVVVKFDWEKFDWEK